MLSCSVTLNQKHTKDVCFGTALLYGTSVHVKLRNNNGRQNLHYKVAAGISERYRHSKFLDPVHAAGFEAAKNALADPGTADPGTAERELGSSESLVL
jgi:hypothetical protein